jgi:hypothetical protein
LTTQNHDRAPLAAEKQITRRTFPLCSTTSVFASTTSVFASKPLFRGIYAGCRCRKTLNNVEQPIELSKSVEICRRASQTVVEMAKGEEYTKAEQQWIVETRNRLAQRRGRKPATKAGQIRALWPEIRTAIADGQSLASIRQWLEEEGGIVVTVQSLGSYLTRIRRKELANPVAPTPPPALSPTETMPLFSNPRTKAQDSTKKKRGFHYPPGPPDESKLI